MAKELKTDEEYNNLRMEFLEGIVDSEFTNRDTYTIYVKDNVDVYHYANIAERYFQLNSDIEFDFTAKVINQSLNSNATFKYTSPNDLKIK